MKKDRSNPSPNAELLNATAAADIAGVAERSWHRHVASGKAPQAVRIGRSVRWRRSDINRWIAEGCPPCRPEVRL
jgi:predicted DNA-binding transcriptional regulator AlpA